MKFVRALALTTMAIWGSISHAAYPEKPIKALVPFPAGQSTDILARAITDELSKIVNQPIYVDNKGGAGGIVGLEAAKRAAPDGYTIIFGSSGPLAINPSLYKNLPYNTLEDFDAVAMIVEHPQYVLVRADSPFNSLSDLLEEAKKRPGELNFASGGVGLTNHLTMEMLKTRAGVDVRHIPYRGASAALTGLVGGETDVMFESPAAFRAFLDSGRVKILAKGSQKPTSAFTDVKSVHEQGVPGFEATTWAAVLVPKGTPAEAINVLNKGINEVMMLPSIQKRLNDLGIDARIATPEETAKFFADQIELWKDAAEKAGIQPE